MDELKVEEQIPEQNVEQKEVEEKKEEKIEKVDMTEHIKADEQALYANVSNFEYLVSKVAVLQEEIELIQRILNQNNLKYTIEAHANTDIEDKTFSMLEEHSRGDE